jgi:hypothetical protein
MQLLITLKNFHSDLKTLLTYSRIQCRAWVVDSQPVNPKIPLFYGTINHLITFTKSAILGYPEPIDFNSQLHKIDLQEIYALGPQVSSSTEAFNLYFVSIDSSVSIALGYGLDDRGSRVRFPTEVGTFSLHRRVQNGSGAHPTSYPVDTRGSFPGGKADGA